MDVQLEMTKQSPLHLRRRNQNLFLMAAFSNVLRHLKEVIITRLITLIINDGYCSAVSLKQRNEVM